MRHSFEDQLRLMHLGLVGEDVLDEVEGVPQLELFDFGHKIVQIDQPVIENLIRLAQKQVDLRDSDHYIIV